MVSNMSPGTRFLLNLLQTTYDSDGNPQVMLPFLLENLEKINEELLEDLRKFRESNLLKLSDDRSVGFAYSLGTLSDILMDFRQGERRINVEMAIVALEIALQIYANVNDGKSWAAAQERLGRAYRNRIQGNPEDKAKKAIACYQEAIKVYNRNDFPLQWAACQYKIGVAYAEFSKPATRENLQQAFVYFDIALKIITPHVCPQEWSLIQFDYGRACRDLIQITESTDEIVEIQEKEIKCYENALKFMTLEKHSFRWADCQYQLGWAFALRKKEDRSSNLQQAINCYKNALQVYTKEISPKEWAMAKWGFYNASAELVSEFASLEQNDDQKQKLLDQKQEWLDQIIIHQYDFINFSPRESDPFGWAFFHYKLGIAYNERLQGDPAENQEKAIECYQKSLQVFNADLARQEWAITQMNLGNAYINRVLGNPEENIEIAIKCYEQALQVHNEDFIEEWSDIQHNLGLAYRDRKSESKADNLANAIRCFKNALKFRTPQNVLERWADTQNMLAQTYWLLDQFDQAITIANETLKFINRENCPPQWAMAQEILAICYQEQQQIPDAIKSLKESLKVFTPKAFPQYSLKVARLLGNNAFKAKQWSIAIEGYSQAIEVIEKTRGWATSESRRVEILKEDIYLYQRIIRTYINNGQLEKAFEYAERSRAKRLVDLMATNLYQDGNIPRDVKKLNEQYEAKQREIDHIRNRNQDNPEDIERLETEKQQIWEQLRKSDFVLAAQKQVSVPNFEEMKQLIDNSKTAILSFYTTSSDTHIFVLRQNEINLHTCTGQGIENLQAWIIENWLAIYKNDNLAWENNISKNLTELAQRLQITKLITEHLQEIEELILVPHIYLHLMPFAALPIGNNQYLGDKFLIRYTPSCQVLDFCKKRPSIETAVKYGTVEDATDDLPCASFECEQIAQRYKIPDDLRLKGSSQATKNNYRQLVKHQKVQVLHSSHHASSRLDQPLESILVLANGETLTLGELLTPGWRVPDLLEVFLSCCETNVGNPGITDDILTIGFGFLCAGARNVVSTLWSVNDLATAIFCILYYQYRQPDKEMSRPIALQKAQQELRTLTGYQFETRYKQNLSEMLKIKLPEAEANWKEAQNEMMKYQKNSPEYLAWQQEWAKRYKIVTKIKNAEKRIASFKPDELPFSHPMYWAGFTCSGLR
jgi:CHAT domain-containing protein